MLLALGLIERVNALKNGAIRVTYVFFILCLLSKGWLVRIAILHTDDSGMAKGHHGAIVHDIGVRSSAVVFWLHHW